MWCLLFVVVSRGRAIAQSNTAGSPTPTKAAADVVLIMTDDQGIGDLAFNGNPVLKMPNLDRLAQQSARMTNFCVSPVCAPTRASLLTGRYNPRTAVHDTYLGRAMIEPDEITIAEVLHGVGYATGIFGKWHLGDTAPRRPIDQGFDEAWVHRGACDASTMMSGTTTCMRSVRSGSTLVWQAKP